MKRMAIVILALFASALYAQQPPPEDDPIGGQLFPPDLIMAQSQRLQLDPQQRTAIKNLVEQAQSKFIDLQWDLREAREAMGEMLGHAPIDEGRVLQQADKVLGLEQQIKKIQLTMLIRIKNTLTSRQIAQLNETRHRVSP